MTLNQEPSFWENSQTHNYAALVKEAFAIYLSFKRLSFYLQDAKCTILQVFQI